MFDRLQAQREQRQHKQDTHQDSIVAVVALDQIEVAEQRTRPLNSEHVSELLDSISTVGLGQPLITDSKFRLIAGGHRLAAIQRLSIESPLLFKQHFYDGIPVRVYKFDALTEPDRAEQIEIAENEKRRDYTAGEVKALAKKYMEQGYTPVKGRPKQGEKPLVPALASYFRVSRRTIQKYLYSDDQEQASESTPVESAKPFALSMKARQVKGHIDSLLKIRAFLQKESIKGSRSIDSIIERLELRLKDEQIDF